MDNERKRQERPAATSIVQWGYLLRAARDPTTGRIRDPAAERCVTADVAVAGRRHVRIARVASVSNLAAFRVPGFPSAMGFQRVAWDEGAPRMLPMFFELLLSSHSGGHNRASTPRALRRQF